jgi:hypothetical protein
VEGRHRHGKWGPAVVNPKTRDGVRSLTSSYRMTWPGVVRLALIVLVAIVASAHLIDWLA